ncbi:MAG: flagellar motor switch protein FliN [Planctomycetota bacterium]
MSNDETEPNAALEDAMNAATVQPVAFGPLSAGGPTESSARNLDLLMDLEVPVAVEIGRAMVTLERVVKLVPGSIVPLDKKAEEPVDLRVNGKLVARGEVVLVDDVYGLRITQIIDAAGRIATLK